MKKCRLRPLKDWILVEPLSATESAKIENGEKASPLALVMIDHVRAMGEQPVFYRWCRVMAVHNGYTEVKPGDVVFCHTISGSHGVNNDYQKLDGVNFLQMPTKDVMGVLE